MSLEEKSPPANQRLRILIRASLAVLLLVALFLAARFLGDRVPQFSVWVDGLGLWAPVVFIAGYAFATVAFVPGSLMTLAAGAVFGLLRGTIIVFIGASLGAALAFLASRGFARSAMRRVVGKRFNFEALDRAVAGRGFKIVLLLRLSPVFPFNLLNYALGLTRVRFSDYLSGSIGMLPATFLYVYYGKALGSVAVVASGASVERGSGYWIVLVVGLAATIAVTALVTRLARRALEEEVPDDD